VICQERLRLFGDYRETTRVYADAVRDMTDPASCESERDLDPMRRVCRTAWDIAEKARLALSRHEANHTCDRSDFRAPIVPGILPT
jgi:hypothetical protein